MKGNEDKVQENEIVDKSYYLSKDVYLKFIELDLWSKFQSKLWTIVGVFLTIISIAGIFGIPYYIKNELNNRLVIIEKDYVSKQDNIIAYSKLLNVVSVLREAKAIEISNETANLLEKLEHDVTLKNNHRINDLLRTLPTIIYEHKIYRIHSYPFKILENDTSISKKNILPSQMIYKESSVSDFFSSGGGASHPINNGTIGGVIKDIKFKLAHLEALDKIIFKIKSDLLILGSNNKLDEAQMKSLIDATYKDKYEPIYDSLLLNSYENYFYKVDTAQFKRYSELYRVNFRALDSGK